MTRNALANSTDLRRFRLTRHTSRGTGASKARGNAITLAIRDNGHPQTSSESLHQRCIERKFILHLMSLRWRSVMSVVRAVRCAQRATIATTPSSLAKHSSALLAAVARREHGNRRRGGRKTEQGKEKRENPPKTSSPSRSKMVSAAVALVDERFAPISDSEILHESSTILHERQVPSIAHHLF